MGSGRASGGDWESHRPWWGGDHGLWKRDPEEVLRRIGGGDFAETVFNEPLVSERSFDAEEALEAIKESRGYVFGFPDDVALRYTELLRSTAGINPLPASALVLAGLVKFVRKFGITDGRFVLVVTGGVFTLDEALILAEGRYKTSDGKTAHGLVRYSKRFRIVGVIDSTLAGLDAGGEVLDGRRRGGIPIYATLEEALSENPNAKWLIIGVATPGGKLPDDYKETVVEAIRNGLGVVNGLHHFLSDDPYLKHLARRYGVGIIDVRKIFYNTRIPFTGRINDVKAIKVAVLGTDAAIGKRTVAIMLHESFRRLGLRSVFIAMGQTGWMQGFKYAIVTDSIIDDFVSGAIEDVFYRAWVEERPDVIVTHGEGSLLHPAFPGGFDLMAAARPDFVVLQHAPPREKLSTTSRTFRFHRSRPT